jgi:hypothetical protein
LLSYGQFRPALKNKGRTTMWETSKTSVLDWLETSKESPVVPEMIGRT